MTETDEDDPYALCVDGVRSYRWAPGCYTRPIFQIINPAECEWIDPSDQARWPVPFGAHDLGTW